MSMFAKDSLYPRKPEEGITIKRLNTDRLLMLRFMPFYIEMHLKVKCQYT